MRSVSLALLALLAPLVTAPLTAQPLRPQCDEASRDDVRGFCNRIVDGVLILQPRIGFAAAGGNPVPGTASTLGMRIGSTPRIGLGLRITAVDTDLPAIERVTGQQDVNLAIGSINADVTVGLFHGFSVAPTIGGVASLDLIGSIGIVPLTVGDGFDDDSPITWAAGARLGLVRESFTAPGLSISGLFRSVGPVTYGSATLADRDATFSFSDQSVLSVRGTLGKRVLGVGLTAGVGLDRFSSALEGRIRDPRVLEPNREITLAVDPLEQDRLTVFGNASFTLLILNMAAELGWQDGAQEEDGASERLDRRGLFGSLALRLTF